MPTTARHARPITGSSTPPGASATPTLASYPITTTFEWVGRYRHQDGWVALGRIDRRTTVAYEVVEVVGVLTGP